MTRRRALGLALAGSLALAALTACQPSPTPTPTPTATGFADEDAAFAAAEATYRAYVDASNAVDFAEPETFEDVYRWTTGTANAAEREALSTYHAEGWTRTGSIVVEDFVGLVFAPDRSPSVVATACTDISTVEVLDAGGASQVAADRPDRYELRLEFVAASQAAHGLQLASSTAVEADRCA